MERSLPPDQLTCPPESAVAARSTLPVGLSAKARRTTEQPISFLINEAMKNPALINLAAGLVDPLTLPVAECDAIARRIFADPARGRAALQYDTTLGTGALRRKLLVHLAALEGVPAAGDGAAGRPDLSSPPARSRRSTSSGMR